MWAVAYTHSQKEFFAKVHIEQQGFKTYLPCYQKKIKRGNSLTTKVLFPRYLFVQINDQQNWRPILSTRGVQTLLLSSKLKPQTISDPFISELKSLENDSGFIDVKTASDLKPGANIKINEGSFVGQVGTIISMSDNDRIKVLVDILGTSTEIEIFEKTVDTI